MHIGIGKGVPLGGGARRYQTFDISGIFGTGQSLSLGQSGTPVLSTSQPFENLMFEGGVRSLDEADLESFVPLVEGTDPAAETPMSACANFVSARAATRARDHVALCAGSGQGSTAYVHLAKGQTLYQKAIDQVTAAKALADADGKSFGVSAFVIVHGESDAEVENDEYADNLVTWQSDLEGDIRAITGQRGEIPHFHTQASSTVADDPLIVLEQLAAHKAASGKVILVGPKYHLPYVDGVHLTNEGYRQLGEMYGRVYDHVVNLGHTWEPVRPREVSRVGAVVTVRFHVPVPPLVFDTTIVEAVGDMGFSWGGEEVVESVEITGPDTVEVTLSDDPGGPGQIRFGTLTGAGNLRDSDATPSQHGYALHNWCVHFSEEVS